MLLRQGKETYRSDSKTDGVHKMEMKIGKEKKKLE